MVHSVEGGTEIHCDETGDVLTLHIPEDIVDYFYSCSLCTVVLPIGTLVGW